jgi:hypothetical protein
MTSEARLFLLNLLTLGVGWGVFAGACGFAVIKGGRPERIGAAAFFLSNLVYLVFQVTTGRDFPVVQNLFMNFAMAFTFLVLAIRYNNLWLGAAMMLSGAEFSLHAAHLMDLGDPHLGPVNLYALAGNLFDLALCGILVWATLSSMKQRRAQGRSNPTAGPQPKSRPTGGHSRMALN